MRSNDRYRQIIKWFEGAARAHVKEPVRIGDPCDQAGTTQRMLARALRAVHGTTPHRYLQACRLSEVPRVLASDPQVQTVTGVATQFGFRQLGRFAALYRKHFGESPSETIRLARLPKTNGRHAPGRPIQLDR